MAKMTFGLTPKNIEVIEYHLSKWEGAKYDSHTWESIGKEIGWHPLTAALWYSRIKYRWRSFENIVSHEGMRVEAWHKIWKCVFAVEFNSKNDPHNPWMSISKTVCWPSEAFSHFRMLSEGPLEGDKDGN